MTILLFKGLVRFSMCIIVIYLSLGQQATNVISPTGCFKRGLPTMILSHMAEEQGEHYLSLTHSGLDSIDNELDRFRNQTHTDCHPVNTQFSQCAVSFDQQFTESTVIPTSAARSHTSNRRKTRNTIFATRNTINYSSTDLKT